MPIIGLIAAIVIGPPQAAPSDVPRKHWAYPAVDRLFREGLLKGYPTNRAFYKLDKSIELDKKRIQEWTLRWANVGLLPETYHATPCGHPYDQDSPYVMATNVYYALQGAVESTPKHAEAELPRLALAISMLRAELTKLGADPRALIAKLIDLRDGRNRQFIGSDR
jgi:hypothetical protein